MNEKHKLLSLNINNFILLALSIMALIQSCEYELDNENFIEKEQVPDTHMFEISSTPEGDTIEVFERTDFLFDMNTFGLNAREAEISLGDSSWGYYLASSSIEFEINPELFENGYHKLKLKVLTNTGTGTIADQVGAEGYVVEKEWTLLFDNRPAPELLVEKSIDSNRHLTFTWNKCTNDNFDYYQLYISNGIHNKERIVIRDPDSTQYIDSLFFGGEYRFSLQCRTVNTENSSFVIEFDDPIPQLQYKEIGFDSLRLSWKLSPYNSRYKLTGGYMDDIVFENTYDTTITIPNPGFGTQRTYRLWTSSKYFDEWFPGTASWTSIEYQMGEYSPAVFFMTYNQQDNIIYSQQFSDLNAFDANTFNQVSTIQLEDLQFGGRSSSPTNSTKVVIGSKYKIFHFENQNLDNPLIIEYEEGQHFHLIDYILHTDNNKICYVSPETSSFKVIDIETQQVETVIEIEDYPIYSNWACLTASQNGEQFCVVSRNGLKLYNIGEGAAEEVYTDNRDYRSAYFDPQNPDLLYLTLYNNNHLEVRNSSNFNLVKTLDIATNAVIQNIDPVSNYLLALSPSERIQIINPENNELILSAPDAFSIYGCRLYNNTLIDEYGMTLNLSEILNK